MVTWFYPTRLGVPLGNGRADAWVFPVEPSRISILSHRPVATHSIVDVKAKQLTADTDHEILTTTELAAFLRCNKSTIYKLANAGELPGFKLGSDWRFPIGEIVQWLSKASSGNRLDRPTFVAYSKRGKRQKAL